MNPTMKRWTLSETGRQNLKLIDAEIPQPGPNEVLVRVDAVSLNFRDKVIIDGGMGKGMAMPLTPGSDMAGVVERWGRGRPVSAKAIVLFHLSTQTGLTAS